MSKFDKFKKKFDINWLIQKYMRNLSYFTKQKKNLKDKTLNGDTFHTHTYIQGNHNT